MNGTSLQRQSGMLVYSQKASTYSRRRLWAAHV